MNTNKKTDAKSTKVSKKSKGNAKTVDTKSLDPVKAKNTIPIKWLATLIDAGDGSGDCFIELPDDLMSQLGWKLGDTLDFEVADRGGCATLRKIDDPVWGRWIGLYFKGLGITNKPAVQIFRFTHFDMRLEWVT